LKIRYNYLVGGEEFSCIAHQLKSAIYLSKRVIEKVLLILSQKMLDKTDTDFYIYQRIAGIVSNLNTCCISKSS
jgi:hypothetical protein